MDVVNVSTFKATCLSLLKKVKHTGEPLLITLRGEPLAEIRPPDLKKDAHAWLGSASGTGTIVSEIMSPTGEIWEAETSGN